MVAGGAPDTDGNARRSERIRRAGPAGALRRSALLHPAPEARSSRRRNTSISLTA